MVNSTLIKENETRCCISIGDIAKVERNDKVVIVLNEAIFRLPSDETRSVKMSCVLSANGVWWIATSSLCCVNLSSECVMIDT